jgi:hypothetical protein
MRARRPTRRGGRPRQVPGVGEEIRREVQGLAPLAAQLNQPQSPEALRRIVEATITAGGPPPFIPSAAAQLYNTWAQDFTFRYRAAPGVESPRWPGVALIQAVISDEAARSIPLLHSFFENPERGRLRSCAQCQRWFIDLTRNRSARRCSRACTIAWSNAQRPTRERA